MQLHSWLNKVIGTVVRDGQCVAFFRQYIQDVWRVPPFEGLGEEGGAKDLFFKHESLRTQARHCDCITYYANIKNRPQCGDIVIFNESSTNKYGHVAIFISDTVDGMLVAEQDGFKKDGGKFALWGNERLLGWLHKKD